MGIVVGTSKSNYGGGNNSNISNEVADETKQTPQTDGPKAGFEVS